MLSPLPEVAQSSAPSRAGRDVLRAIGEDLDRDIYPVVHTNGTVMPDLDGLGRVPCEEQGHGGEPHQGAVAGRVWVGGAHQGSPVLRNLERAAPTVLPMSKHSPVAEK